MQQTQLLGSLTTDGTTRRLTGFAGIAWVVTTGLGVALFSAAGTPPPFDDASAYARFVSRAAPLLLGDGFLSGVGGALLVAYFVGFAWLTRSMDNGRSLAPWLLLSFGTLTAGMLTLASVLETATVYVSGSASQQSATPSFWLAMNMALVFLYFPAAGALATQAMAIRQTAVLPRWTALPIAGAAFLVALASLSIFGGTGDLGPLGMVQVMVGFVPSALAVLVVSVSMLRPLRRAAGFLEASPLVQA